MHIDDEARQHLRRCIELATEAVEAGDEPFGSVLVDAGGAVLAEDRNRVVATDDQTRHPEFELARWAAANLEPARRARATVFTSGEHCPMCAAAHAWVGLGPIVYIHSSAQLREWLDELGAPAAPVRTLAIQEVAPGVEVGGPVVELVDEMRALQHRYHQGPDATRPPHLTAPPHLTDAPDVTEPPGVSEPPD